MTARAILATVLAMGAFGRAYGQSTVTLLDTAGDVGHNAAVGIGTDGLPLIAYADLSHTDLKVAHCDDAACTAATISTVDATGSVGAGSMAIGADGLGFMVYPAGPNVKVAHCNDTACTSAASTLLDPNAPYGRPSVTIGSDGLPLVAYVRQRSSPTFIVNELVAAHCANAACTSATSTVLREMPFFPGGNVLDTAVVTGQDGLALIAYSAVVGTGPWEGGLGMAHCANTACTFVTPAPPSDSPEGGGLFVQRPSIAIGADGRALVSFRRVTLFIELVDFRVRRCADVACTSFSSDVEVPLPGAVPYDLPVAMSPSGKPWFLRSRNHKTRLAECADDACTTWTEDTCANASAAEYALVRGADGQPLVAFYQTPNRDLGVVHGFSRCLPSVVGAVDGAVFEYGAVVLPVPVTLDAPTDVGCSVQYTTVDGTAVAGLDYTPVSGTLSFEPGSSGGLLLVEVTGDVLDEDDEQFQLVLSNPIGCSLGDATATLTIVDDDPQPDLRIGDCSVVEGTGTPTACAFEATLSAPSGRDVRVAVATQDETATAGSDYTAASGVITFAPGVTARTVAVSVAADAVVENDETFRLDLGNVMNATLLVPQAQGAILDDDAPPLPGLELAHGSVTNADLAAQPGPAADADLYRLAQPAFTSWEVVADAVSGDVAPGLVLERLGADQETVLQSGAPVGTGGSVSLRFQNRLTATVSSQPIRVHSEGCTTDCGADDVYRLRTYETTGRLARFNNAFSQVTVVLLQNPQAVPARVSIDFWSPEGERLATHAATVPPWGVLVVNTSTIPALQETSGTITVSNDAPYGALAGKAVALEPATGYSFDSTLEYRPR